jgi:hypothetical protein
MKLHFPGIKTFLLLVVCCAAVLFAGAQQSHFMYIQSDNKAPFYVVLDKKTYNSNGTGYLIVSKITKGEHLFTLGFPDNKYPVQSFTCDINDADAGYALKNYGEKGWGLFNLQSMAVIMGVPVTGGKTPAPKETEPTTATPAVTTATQVPANQFGDMLSQVVGDPTLQNKTVKPVKQPAKKAEQPVVKDTVVVADAAAAVVPEEDAIGAAATRGVIKAGEKAGKEGTGYVFIDFNSKGADTVKIFIPAAMEEVAVSETAAAVDSAVTVVKEDAPVEKKAEKKKRKEPEFVEPAAGTAGTVTEGGVSNPFYTKPATETVKTETTGSTTAEPASEPPAAKTSTPDNTKVASYNSNCSGGMAVDKDLDKLKKRMVGENSDDKMVSVARKAFKAKCYTTEQIKELGRLFYTDESRYQFYDAAYPFVYDVSNFISLENMLLDDYYKKRFRAMLRL